MKIFNCVVCVSFEDRASAVRRGDLCLGALSIVEGDNLILPLLPEEEAATEAEKRKMVGAEAGWKSLQGRRVRTSRRNDEKVFKTIDAQGPKAQPEAGQRGTASRASGTP